jgi:assimilatory nitrate reductase catalytic subunit
MTMTTSNQDAHTVEIAADPNFPVNLGQMCIKGFSSGPLLTHKNRITQPLIRDASGVLQPATWDEALDFVVAKIKHIQSTRGRDAMGVFGSGSLTNEKVYWLGKFARLALGTRMIDYNGRYCMSSAAGAQNKAFGVDRGLPFPVNDIGQTRTLILWGANVADTLPPIMQWVNQCKQNGGTLISIDPRRTETAAASDIHLQPTPGTDLALANGLLWIAIDQNQLDLDYIQQRTNGFSGVRAAVSRYHPAYVERLTGIDEATMRRVVDLLASGPAMLLSGRGPEQQSKGVDTALACINLMLAMGHCGKPFAGFGTLTGQGNGQGGREHGQKADQLPGYRLIEEPADRAAMCTFWGITDDELPRKGLSAVEMLDRLSEPDGIAGLLVAGSNIAVATPNSGKLIERLKKLDLLVVLDSLPNETQEHAHVVLPVLQWAEEEGTMTNLEGRVIRRRVATSAPTGPNSPKSDLEVLSMLAQRMGCAKHFGLTQAREVFEEFTRATRGAKADYSGISYDAIDDNEGVHWPCNQSAPKGTPRVFVDRFFHADGRAKFNVVEYRDAAELPCRDYPIYFTTGRYREQYNSGSQTRRVDKLLDARPAPRLQMHPRLATKLGFYDGQRVRVKSRRGQVVFELQLTSSIRPDTVFAPFHYGGKEAANLLTNPALDPTSRMPEFKICAVHIAAETETTHA